MKLKRLILIIISISLSMSLFSQQQIKIKSILDKYGKQEGSVLVQLSSDILSQGSDLTLYKSLIIDKAVEEKKLDILNEITPEIKKWKNFSEIKKEGIIQSGTYYIEIIDNKNTQYLLIKNTSKKLTIVYIEGNFPVNKLQDELKKLKNLFIYVNNKKINIQ